jgi:GT2 family glycosyltransferase
MLGVGEESRRGGAAAHGRAAGEVATALDVVIVSYRSRELLRACLNALRGHPPNCPMKVFVVDNASDDATLEMMRGDFPEVELIVSGRNLGFARATNVGLRRGSAEYVLALNPDTRLTSGALDRLMDLMEAQPKIGISGPRLFREDGSLDHAAKRSFPTPTGALAHFAGIGRSQYRAPHVEQGPVDAVNGAFMLMRRTMLDEVGLFDEGYWMYMEDLDLCYRAMQAGWTTWYEPSAAALHVKHGSGERRTSPRLAYAFHRGMYRFYRRHYAGTRSHATNAVVYLGIAIKLAYELARSAGAAGTRNVRERLGTKTRTA